MDSHEEGCFITTKLPWCTEADLCGLLKWFFNRITGATGKYSLPRTALKVRGWYIMMARRSSLQDYTRGRAGSITVVNATDLGYNSELNLLTLDDGMLGNGLANPSLEKLLYCSWKPYDVPRIIRRIIWRWIIWKLLLATVITYTYFRIILHSFKIESILYGTCAKNFMYAIMVLSSYICHNNRLW